MSSANPSRDRYWPRAGAFKRALGDGSEDQLAMWVTLPSIEIVEMLGALGVEAAIIDREHSVFEMETIVSLIAACELEGMAPLIRPTKIDAQEVTRFLDHGAEGIVFPMVCDGDAAAAARATLRYPPAGTRGWGGRHVRGLRWLGPENQRSSEYVEAANEAHVSVFLIENVEGVENIEEILDRGRPDAVIFGWGDFGVAAGFDPEVALEASDRVYRACRDRGIGVARDPAQLTAPDPYPGCFTISGVESTLIADALGAHVAKLRST